MSNDRTVRFWDDAGEQVHRRCARAPPVPPDETPAVPPDETPAVPPDETPADQTPPRPPVFNRRPLGAKRDDRLRIRAGRHLAPGRLVSKHQMIQQCESCMVRDVVPQIAHHEGRMALLFCAAAAASHSSVTPSHQELLIGAGAATGP